MGRSIAVEVLLDAAAELGEGPVWDAARGSLIWIDQLAGRVHRVGLDGRPQAAVEVGRRVGCAVPRLDGGLLLAVEEGFALLDERRGPEIVAEVAADAPASFVNDGRCDALGRFWAGTVGIAADGRPAGGSGALHRLDADLRAHVAHRGLTLSNGMDWSPDGATMYLIDSSSGGIDAFPFDLQRGELGRPRRVVDLGIESATGFADGMCVDADGCLWTAVWGTGEVRRYTPAGALERVVRVPVSQPTSCAFAGEGLDVLVITSAWHGLPPRRRELEPHAGAIFCCRPGAVGLETRVFGA